MKYLVTVWIAVAVLLLFGARAPNPTQAQSRGSERRLKIKFTSAPERAQFSFVFRDQQVRGITTVTKVFTSEYNFEATAVFSRAGFRNCQKRFKVEWVNEDEGTLTVEGEQQQQFNFSAAAAPPVVNCDFEKMP